MSYSVVRVLANRVPGPTARREEGHVCRLNIHLDCAGNIGSGSV